MCKLHAHVSPTVNLTVILTDVEGLCISGISAKTINGVSQKCNKPDIIRSVVLHSHLHHCLSSELSVWISRRTLYLQNGLLDKVIFFFFSVNRTESYIHFASYFGILKFTKKWSVLNSCSFRIVSNRFFNASLV
jgi:hypothetical protein